MLSKKNRADTKTVEEIFKKGEFFNTSHLTFRFIKKTNTIPPRISFTVPKSVWKSAVKRNMLRRRGYSVLEKKINEFPLGIIGVFIFRKPETSVATLENDIKVILGKI